MDIVDINRLHSEERRAYLRELWSQRAAKCCCIGIYLGIWLYAFSRWTR
jgi:hypothetical protein